MTQLRVTSSRDAACWTVPAEHFCRILCRQGRQVGDLNLFHAHDLDERLFAGKTRALSGTHVGPGDQLFSSFPPTCAPNATPLKSKSIAR